MAEVKVEARPNGPYVVTGSIELLDTNGNILSTQERTVLCRCGASTRKPFCDGTHSKIGFQKTPHAPNAPIFSRRSLYQTLVRSPRVAT